MTVLMFILAMYGLGTVAYQVTGLAIEAAAKIKKVHASADTLVTPINRKKVAA